MTGRVAGNYRILEKLGQGGMGAVFRAVDAMVERPAAIKVLKPEIAGDPEVAARFHTEAVTLARLNHPGIAMLYSFFREGGEMFMAMEYVPGPTLNQVLHRGGAMPWKQASEMVVLLLEALQHAHGLGVLHRDIKPANIILPPQGGLKVTDFGIAQVLGKARLTREGTIVGTLTYLAPERIQGNPAVEASDIYSVGIVFYQMLSGRVPFQGKTDLSLMRAQLEQQPPPVVQFAPGVPEPIAAVLNRSLEKDPLVRYTSAAAMAEALRDAIAEVEGVTVAPPFVQDEIPTTFVAPPPPPPPSVILPAPPPPRSRWPLAIGIAGGVLIAGGATAWVMLSRSTHEKPAEPVQVSRVESHAPQPMNPQTLPQTPPAKPDGEQTSEPAAAEQPSKPAPRTISASKASLPPDSSPPPVQSQSQSQRQPQPQPDTPPPVTPPTVAPPPAPAPSPVVEARPSRPPIAVLADVKTLFIAPMPDQLEDAVRSEMNKQLRSRIRLAGTREESDATIQCWVEDSGGGVTSAPGRVLGVKGRKSATFKIFDRTGKNLLWQEEVSDRRGVLHFRVDSNEKLAERVVSKLKKDLK